MRFTKVHDCIVWMSLASLVACSTKVDGTLPPDLYGPDTVLDTTRGTINGEVRDYAVFPGLVGVPNLDDDDENGEPDWVQKGQASGDDDYALATLRTGGNIVELRLKGEGIRIYQLDTLVLGDGAEDALTISGQAEGIDLRVEFADFLTRGTLTVEDQSAFKIFEVALTASPLIFNHHLQPSEETMAMSIRAWGTDNDDFIAGYEAALGDEFFTLNSDQYEYDVWVQDEFEFAYATSPDSHLDVIFDTLRDGQSGPGGGLDNFPEDEYAGPDWLITNFDGDRVSSLDYGGNFEVSPPVTVDGVHYPYGRVYYGGEGGYQPLDTTQEAVESFQIQKPFMPDSTWLCVGHIDEFTTTIPDPTAPKGFRFVISDTRSAWALLESMDPSTDLSRYAGGGYSGHGLRDIGAIVDNTPLRNLNTEVQEILDEQEALFRKELGLDDEDIIYMPSLFEEVSGCGGTVAALIPGMANLVVADSGDQPTVFMADPFLRSDLSDQSSDPMIAEVTRLFPESLDLVFLDDWYIYHMGLGEVHCGSNVKRTAPRTWWEDAGHLLSEEGAR